MIIIKVGFFNNLSFFDLSMKDTLSNIAERISKNYLETVLGSSFEWKTQIISTFRVDILVKKNLKN